MKTNSTTVSGRILRIAGSLLWFASLMWYFSQYAVASAWKTPYSLVHNYVSDLGATRCGDFPVGSTSYVCSPLHDVMNTSFILWGLVWMVGGVLFAVAARQGAHRLAYFLVALGGLGTVFIGIVPETVNFSIHSFAALIQTAAFTAGLVILAVGLLRHHHRVTGWLTIVVAVAAIVGIVATGIAEDSGDFLGVGLGIWERISLWPIPVWLAVAGIGTLWSLADTASAQRARAERPTLVETTR